MELSTFTVKLFILFIPGLLAFIIIDNLSIHKMTKKVHWFIYSVILSFISNTLLLLLKYLYAIFVPCYQFDSSTSFFYQLLENDNTGLLYSDILMACFVAILLGIVISRLLVTNKLFSICSRFSLTNRHGYTDALSYMFNLYSVKYITIRDWDKNIVIIGELVATSEVTDARNEIVLQDCSVYRLNDNSHLYDVPVFYLSTEFNNISIEIMEGGE